MRSYTIDAMKLAGILLVVVYHAIDRSNPIITYSNGLFNMIASFFMLMFIGISGYLAYNKVGDWKWTRQRSVKWLAVTIVFMFVYYGWSYIYPSVITVRASSFGEYLKVMLTTGFSGLVTWYLWCLILCYLVGYGVEQIRLQNKRVPVVAILLVIGVLLNVLLLTDSFGFLALKWYGLAFLAGYGIRHYRETRAMNIIGRTSYACLVLFPLAGFLTHWMVPYQSIDYGTFGFGFIYSGIKSGNIDKILLMMAMGLLGIQVFYYMNRT